MPAPKTSVNIGKRTLSLSNLDKVMYPSTGFTKGDVIHYYLAIADAVLPHLRDRPLTLKRYPNGVDGMMFYEKRCPSHRPEWMKTQCVESRGKDGKIDYCLVNEAAALAWVENIASIELHTLLYRAKKLFVPTMVVFDLDPGPPAGVMEACKVGLQMRDLFEKLGLKTFVKHSGGKGLHLVIPLNTKTTFDETKSFAQAVAMWFEKTDPDHATHVMRKDVRGGKVFIDWSQNDEHKTTVTAYSLRARERPTVSLPLKWSEIERAVKRDDVESIRFEADATIKRVKKVGDLFADVETLKQKLPKHFGL